MIPIGPGDTGVRRDLLGQPVSFRPQSLLVRSAHGLPHRL